jgi:hypothetical protein
MPILSEHLDAETCRQKAAECRLMARRDRNLEHRIMLEHMAETWERIAGTYEKGRSLDSLPAKAHPSRHH